MSCTLAVDHVVLTVHDLDAVAATYEALGFQLTPRAAHDVRMGTANRLVQLREGSFIELLEVDRPATLARHRFADEPPFFGFGDHNRRFLERREGPSMLAFASRDAASDHRRFVAADLPTFAPFGFQRRARLPDGSEVTLGFELVFVQPRARCEVAFFACQNRAPEHFWKPAYQAHRNGALGLRTVYLVSDDAARDAALVASIVGGSVSVTERGFDVTCGRMQTVRLRTRAELATLDPTLDASTIEGTFVAGIALASAENLRPISAAEGHGMFIEWVAA